jgi:hypothetical protein
MKVAQKVAQIQPGTDNQFTTSPSFFANLVAPSTNSVKMDRE